MKFMRLIVLLFVSFISLLITDEVRADSEWLVDELWNYNVDEHVLSVSISENGEYIVAGTNNGPTPNINDGVIFLFENNNM